MSFDFVALVTVTRLILSARALACLTQIRRFFSLFHPISETPNTQCAAVAAMRRMIFRFIFCFSRLIRLRRQVENEIRFCLT